jgi:hypothetical protein
MKKYQKLYQLKQIVKAYQEYAKYIRLTGKLEYPEEYDKKYDESAENWRNAIKDTPINFMIDGRLLNVAYCLLKGKKYFQIERSVRQGNQLRDYEWKKITDIMNHFKDEENTNDIPKGPFPITQVNEPKQKVEVSNE